MTETKRTDTRRAELLRIAAGLFAERGFRNTTVRDIADAAGILSGSLYHHFDSKEAMVDEILRTFQEGLFGKYDAILASDDDPRSKLEQAVRVSFEAIDHHRHEVAIFQNEADYLGSFERFGYLAEHGIRVNAVSPSLAMHPFLAKVTSDELLAELKQREAFGRAAEPWEVANVMVFLASDYASYMTGEVVAVSSQQA